MTSDDLHKMYQCVRCGAAAHHPRRRRHTTEEKAKQLAAAIKRARAIGHDVNPAAPGSPSPFLCWRLPLSGNHLSQQADLFLVVVQAAPLEVTHHVGAQLVLELPPPPRTCT
eukprot:COSAG01_NODE_7738_length_3078_cov_82.411547_2_plen_112_part_00